MVEEVDPRVARMRMPSAGLSRDHFGYVPGSIAASLANTQEALHADDSSGSSRVDDDRNSARSAAPGDG